MDNETIREIAVYYIETESTFRQTAKEFGCSKSTVSRIVNKLIRAVDYDLFKEAQELKDRNRKEAHLRGGLSNREHLGISSQGTLERTLTIVKGAISGELHVSKALEDMHMGSYSYYNCLKKEVKVLYPSLYKEYVKSIDNYRKERCLKYLSIYAFKKEN